MDMRTALPDHLRMARKPRRQFRKLYIGEWIARLGRQQSEIAEQAGIDKSYLNNIISGRKMNPGGAVLLDISEALGLSVNDLYRQPPPASAVEAANRLSPGEIAVLARLLDQMKGPPRR
jgi:transcriptional regulator with XRE-family HTH domain